MSGELATELAAPFADYVGSMAALHAPCSITPDPSRYYGYGRREKEVP
jgi:hypothetical protein